MFPLISLLELDISNKQSAHKIKRKDLAILFQMKKSRPLQLKKILPPLIGQFPQILFVRMNKLQLIILLLLRFLLKMFQDNLVLIEDKRSPQKALFPHSRID